MLLIGGDKTGDGRSYERTIPIAEKIWRRYLDDQGALLMTKPWRTARDQRSKLSPARRAAIDADVARESLELSLRDLREGCGFTQQQMADALEMAQGAFSKLERRDDHLMSTLRKVVRALGGDLEVNARFPDKLVRII